MKIEGRITGSCEFVDLWQKSLDFYSEIWFFTKKFSFLRWVRFYKFFKVLIFHSATFCNFLENQKFHFSLSLKLSSTFMVFSLKELMNSASFPSLPTENISSSFPRRFSSRNWISFSQDYDELSVKHVQRNHSFPRRRIPHSCRMMPHIVAL